MALIRQTNFAAGELAPSLYGRTELERYAMGLRGCSNFFISKQGAAVSRPGTLLVRRAKQDSAIIRLVPFIYSDTVSYVLEFGGSLGGGVGYIRFHTAGGTVASPTAGKKEIRYDNYDLSPAFAGGETLTGGTSGATGVLAELLMEGSVGEYGAMILTGVVGTFVDNEVLTGGTSGATADVDGAMAQAPYEVATGYDGSLGVLNKLRWAQSGNVLTLTHPLYPPKTLTRVANDSWTLADVVFSPPAAFFERMPSVGVPENAAARPILVETLPVEDVPNGMPAREWIWKVTAIGQDPTTGLNFESLPYTITESDDATAPADSRTALPATIPVYPARPVTIGIQRTIAPPGSGNGAYMPTAYNIYRGRGTVFGFVGQTSTNSFIDVGEEPDYSIQPPLGTNPFEVKSVTGSVTRTEEPAAVAYFQVRRIFAGTVERPGFIFCSATGEYENFDERTVHLAGEALRFDLLTRRREDIRSILGTSRLLVFTNGSVWSVGGHEGTPLDFDSFDCRVIEGYGANYMQPLEVGELVLYGRSTGNGVRALVPGDGPSGFKGVDVSSAAEHLFLPRASPLTGFVSTNFFTDPSRLSLYDWAYQAEPWGVVWACNSRGQLFSLTFSADGGMWGWARHSTGYGKSGTYAARSTRMIDEVRSICCVPEGDEDAVYMNVFRWREPNIGWENCIERMGSRVRKFGSRTEGIVLDSAVRYDGTPVETLSGLGHLKGKEVYVAGFNFTTLGPFTVDADGVIDMGDAPAANFDSGATLVVHAGLKYEPELESLDAVPSERLRKKTIVRVGFEVDEDEGVKVGQDFDHLTTSNDTISEENGLIWVPVLSKWDEYARVVLRQTTSKWITVSGIAREVDVGE